MSMTNNSSMLPMGLVAQASGWDAPLRNLLFRSPTENAAAAPTDNLFMWILWFSVICFVGLMFVMMYWVVVYRRRPGVPPTPSPGHNTPLELAWTIIPLIPLAYIFFTGFDTYLRKLVAPANAYEIIITGKKWAWSAKYPNGAESAITKALGARPQPVFPVPGGVPVKLRMSSQDVIHSFWIPDMRMKQDVVPNRYTSYWFQAQDPSLSGADVQIAKDGDGTGLEPGTPYRDHWVFCAEYCGDLHAEMLGIIRVVPEAAFTTLVAGMTGANLSPVDLGRKLYVSRGCNACHSIDGGKNTGPTFQNLYARAHEFTDGSALSTEDMTGDGFANYVRESILVPGAKIVKGYPNQMPSFQGQFNDREINAMIAFIKSISDKAPQDEPAAEGAAPAGGEAAPEQ